MCCCGKPVINGQPGYKWQPGDVPSVRQVSPPDIQPDDKLLYDEPGRCGGLDAHCHHYRVIKRDGWIWLLVRHGGGSESMKLDETPSVMITLSVLDTNARFWLLSTLWHAYRDGRDEGRKAEYLRWYMAAAQKRIKVRKDRGSDAFTVKIVN